MARTHQTMKAWTTTETAGDLVMTSKPVPRPGAGEVLVRVDACGICRTDLHIIDRELPVHHADVTPGHQVVGTVVGAASDVTQLSMAQRVGVAWLHHTCGACQYCRDGRENLCAESRYTGWDVDGGFAEYLTVPEAFAYPLPDTGDPARTAPLLCAGIIGYRALSRARVRPGGKLGIYGFGSSAHLTAKLAIAQGLEIYALTRGEHNRDLARTVGAIFVGEETASPPQLLDAAIVFAPAGNLVPLALKSTCPGGTVVLAGIHMTDIPAMSYADCLFRERDLRTVTANTRADGAAFLRLARALRLAPTITRYPFDHTPAALDALRVGAASGSLVITH